MDRRDFLRTAGHTCAALALMPLAATVEGCSGGKALALSNGAITVPKSQLNAKGTALVKAEGVSGKVFITRRSDGTYTAFELICPHKNGPVSEKGGVLTCAWHGSTFDSSGQVTKGPAKSGLKKFVVEEEGEALRVLVG
jgi:cytochrome b6-f complex iron-sulfur subunit